MDIYEPSVNFDRDRRVVAFAKERIMHGEPCSVVGMHGNGIEYPFAVLTKEIQKIDFPYEIRVLDTISEEELSDFVKKLSKTQKPVIACIKIRIGKDISPILHDIENIRIKKDFGFIPCIFAYVGDVYAALTSMNKILTASMFVLERISFPEAQEMIQELSERFSFSPTDQQKKEIYQWSCGHVALIKSLFLLKKDFPTKKFTEQFLLSEPSILYRLSGIAQEVPQITQRYPTSSLPIDCSYG